MTARSSRRRAAPPCGPDRRSDAQFRKAARDPRVARAARYRGGRRCGPRSRRARGDRTDLSRQRRASRRRPRRGRPASRRSPTIPGSASTRSTARRASIRRAGRADRRTSPPRWPVSNASFARCPRRGRGGRTSSARLRSPWPDGRTETFEGRVDGDLVFPPRGTAGFGYDPIFKPDGHDRTFGEMSAEEKHGIPADGSIALSHRARAFQKFARQCL